jgi:hypothetical protein
MSERAQVSTHLTLLSSHRQFQCISALTESYIAVHCYAVGINEVPFTYRMTCTVNSSDRWLTHTP